MTSYSVKTGGKLYLAGEYAILSPAQAALILNIPIYMTATIEDSDRYSLSSDMFDYRVGLEPDDNYALIQETIAVVHQYLIEKGISLRPFSLAITGKMEQDGKKYGIGSSGSVTVLVVKALAAFYQQIWSDDLIFKLSAYTLIKRGDNGSMGDIACIAYDNLVLFSAFKRSQVAKWIVSNDTVTSVLEKPWGYEIRSIESRLDCECLVGWTKKPSISKDMINQVKSAITQDFLDQTQEAVLVIAQGLEDGNKDAVLQQVERVSQLLQKLHPAIYTPELLSLTEAAKGLAVVAKSSGSGGGDCGIALSFDQVDSEKLIERWQSSGIWLLSRQKL